MLQREYLIHQAPAKDFIPILIAEPSLDTLRTFFRARVEWKSYPIFHERMLSTSLFDDYVPLLKQKPENIFITLDHALSLVLEEDERYILCSVFLISYLCSVMPKEFSPSAVQVQMIEALHQRVEPLSFVLNLSSFWAAVAQYAARANPKLEEDLKVSDKALPSLPQYQFADERCGWNCPVGMEQLNDWLLAYSHLYHPEFRRGMKIVDCGYWVFKCHRVNADGYREYSRDHLCVQQKPNGSVAIFSKNIALEDDELLRQEIIKWHYSPWECVTKNL